MRVSMYPLSPPMLLRSADRIRRSLSLAAAAFALLLAGGAGAAPSSPAATALPAVPTRPAGPSPAAAAPAGASAPSSPAKPARFEDTSQVVAVEVPVNAVGRDGQPVRGLAADDFEVYDEGARQKVSSFEVLDLDQLDPARGAPAGSRDSDLLDATARRHFLLLFDLSFADPIALLKARLAARDFVLHSLRPGDLAAVATFALETGPRLVVTFTPDRAQLARGIDTLGIRQPLAAEERYDPLRFIIEAPASESLTAALGSTVSAPRRAGDRGSQTTGDLIEQTLLEQLYAIKNANDRGAKTYARNKIVGYTRAMAEMAKALNAVRGRKTVVYFSEGFDSKLMLGRENLNDADAEDENLNIAFGRLQFVDSDDRYGNTQLQGAVNRMLEEFRRADCVIQAVDIGGLRTDADASGRPRSAGQEGLFYLANETGGELFKDANNLGEQLDRVLTRTTVTYLLTFQRSDLKQNGAYHHLKVKARLPAGARLSHRSGYYAPRPFKELDALEKNLLASDGIAGAAARNDLDLDVLVAPFRLSQEMAYVPVIIEVGGGRLLAGHAGDKLGVEFYAYVSDARGEMKDFFTQRVAIDVKKGRQTLLKSGVKYYGHVELAPGSYRVRVLVRNSETGRTGVRTTVVSVPSFQQAQPALLPPLFIEAQRGWVMVREKARAGEREAGSSVVYPFTINGEPYVPAARPSLGKEERARLCLVAYNLGAGDLALQGRVTAADGSDLPGGTLALVERTATGIKGLDELIATFQPTGLAAGDYVLQVALTNPRTGHKEVNSLPFQVVR
ncbi:MAG TPA: VWA domain-containing protein [Thermoanaerobaculia bacterium]|nr:VWA domain-containing protein [Thermoanaerobaculia bacterium]